MNEYPNAIPAFPSTGRVPERGMTLRDYFAAKAMQAMLSNPTTKVTGTGTWDQASDLLAEGSFKVADAMLKAREQ
jgi:hypothetical protein